MARKRLFGTTHPFFEGGPVFGRTVANAGFLSALFRTEFFDAYHFFLRDRESLAHLEHYLKERYPEPWKQGCFLITTLSSLPAHLARNDYYCFHFSDWINSFTDVCVQRNRFSRIIFPVTAPVHTLSYARYGAGFLRHLWPGVSQRDVIVATSSATKDVIGGYFRQMREGYGLDEARFAAPAVTRIPLGCDPELFAAPEEKKREGATFRQQYGLDDDDVLFLSFSRVSYLSKMDFLPILDAFLRAEGMGLDLSRCRFVLAGRMHPKDPIGPAMAEFARARGVPFTLEVFPDEPNDERRKALFAAADVFLSPVDNIQETFGLTILEAYAASLPVIASDIDGYRDLVVPGETGYLIPTIGPGSADVTTPQSLVLNNDLYHLFLAQQCVVELAPFAGALAALGPGKNNLRRKMGCEGRRLLLERYTWANVVDEYLALWEKLRALPMTHDEEEQLRGAVHPIIPDYTGIFRHYFSGTANSGPVRQRLVRTTERGVAVSHREAPLVVYKLVQDKVEPERLRTLLRAAYAPIPFGTLADAHIAPEGAQTDRDFLLLWALKHDLLEFVS